MTKQIVWKKAKISYFQQRCIKTRKIKWQYCGFLLSAIFLYKENHWVFLTALYLKWGNTMEIKQESSMILTARFIILPAAITIHTWKLFRFARFWKVRMDVRTEVQTPHAKIVITTWLCVGRVEQKKFSNQQKNKRGFIWKWDLCGLRFNAWIFGFCYMFIGDESWQTKLDGW